MSSSEQREATRDRLLFYPVAFAGIVFCVTVFAVTASMFGDQEVPAKQWLRRFGDRVLVIEAGLLVLIGVLAMTVDRLRTLRRMREATSAAEADQSPCSSSPGSE